MKYYKILTGPEDLKKYEHCDLFYYTNGKYVKFKSKDIDVSEIKVPENLVDDLYIKMSDRINVAKNKQRLLNKELTRSIKVDVSKARTALQKIVNNMLDEPSAPILKESKKTINIIVNEYLENPSIVENLTFVALHDYSTSLHLTNCMLLCLGYAHFNKLSKYEMTVLGLSGLMHDIGKVDIPEYIL